MVVIQNRAVKVGAVRSSPYFTSTETIFLKISEVWENINREKSVIISMLLFICSFY